MLVNKITTGYVIQVYDTDKKKFISQEFTASDICEFEDAETGEKAEAFDDYLCYDMKQPKVKISCKGHN